MTFVLRDKTIGDSQAFRRPGRDRHARQRLGEMLTNQCFDCLVAWIGSVEADDHLHLHSFATDLQHARTAALIA
jgi:hypothetical protein